MVYTRDAQPRMFLESETPRSDFQFIFGSNFRFRLRHAFRGGIVFQFMRSRNMRTLPSSATL